jgi:hypothetical protein
MLIAASVFVEGSQMVMMQLPLLISGLCIITSIIGTYAVRLTMSPRFGRILPLLIDVPGFDGVRIHPGNTAADTEGCLLVGTGRTEDTITGSRDAFNALMLRLEHEASIEIEVS